MKKNIYDKLENDVPMPTKRMLASKSKKATWY
jgi:hypothetical protein